jgi:hypothetical protein
MNMRRLNRLRRELMAQLLEVTAIVDRLDVRQISALREHVDRLMHEVT